MRQGLIDPLLIQGVMESTNSLATVIIPCREINVLTNCCIKECLDRIPGVYIIVIPDKISHEIAYSDQVYILPSGRCNISAKRNLAAKEATTEFLAFIDSDAYPHEDWLRNAVSFLQVNCTVGAVGGPCISPPNEPLKQRIVGNALKSPLVSGPFVYRRRAALARDCKQLSSCNLVVRCQIYLAVGGMNECLYVGEDQEFCCRLVRRGIQIRYSPDVVVFHRNRTLRGLFWQRLIWGMSESEVILSIGKIVKDSFCTLVSAFFMFFLVAGLLLLLSPLLRWVYLAVICVYLIVCILESIRLSVMFREIPGTFLALLIGNLTPGLGMIIKAMGISVERDKVYHNTD